MIGFSRVLHTENNKLAMVTLALDTVKSDMDTVVQSITNVYREELL